MAMSKKTSFEQVPLDVVKKMIEAQFKQEVPTRSGPGIKKRKLGQKPILSEGNGTNGKGGNV
jgi:hypothetical protein